MSLRRDRPDSTPRLPLRGALPDAGRPSPQVAVALLVGHLRGLLPVPLMRLLVRFRTWLAWRNPAVRENAMDEMRFVLEHTRPDADLEATAKRYVYRQALRGELRWHVDLITHPKMVGLEHLLEARSHGRGVVFNWMHHGQLDSTARPISEGGSPTYQIGAPKLFGPLPAWLRQHMKLCAIGGSVMLPANAGWDTFVEVLKDGHPISIAVDVAGRTPVHFLGRDLIGSFGAPRLAMETGAPVVLMTAELEDERDLLPVARIHPPLWPEDFPDARALYERMLELHEPYLVRWPELYDIPTSHWGVPPEPVT
jgi:lauroyl/myristoyl acyltransferase